MKLELRRGRYHDGNVWYMGHWHADTGVQTFSMVLEWDR